MQRYLFFFDKEKEVDVKSKNSSCENKYFQFYLHVMTKNINFAA